MSVDGNNYFYVLHVHFQFILLMFVMPLRAQLHTMSSLLFIEHLLNLFIY